MTCRVLLVEDGAASGALAHLFVDQGCRVRLSGGVAQAAADIKKDAFDAVVADAGMGAELWAGTGGGNGPRLILTAGGGALEVLHKAMEPKDYLDLCASAGRGDFFMDESVDPTCHLTRHLEAAGHRVVRGAGEKSFREGPGGAFFSLAFLDPGRTGWEAWRRLSATGACARAVMPAGPCGPHVAGRFARGEAPVVGKTLGAADMAGLVDACLKSAGRAAASVLLVDDDDPFRESIADLLRAEGFQVEEARRAAEGLTKSLEKDFDVIVSDYHMPDMTGVQMVGKLKERRPHAKIVMLTGEADLDSALRAVELGIAAYLSKPVEPDALLAALNRSLRERRLEGQVQDLLRELGDANKKLEDFDQMKSRFLFLVAHDIRSPLGGAMGYTDFLLLKPQELSAPVKDGLGTIRHALGQVNRLVSDLMDLGRMESGKLSVKPEPIDLPKMAKELKARFEVLAKEEEVSCTLVSDGAPERITADPLRLDQIISNLAGNAIKHSGRGRNVKVSLSAGEDGGLAVDIKDDGPGLKPDQLSRVFEPYYQGEDSMALQKGLGLGLAIVRELVEAHGGRVWVESAGPGAGCTFRVRLPARPPEAKAP